FAGRRRGELDEHAPRALRMQEADRTGEPRTRLLVDQGKPLAARSLELARDVGGLEADVVKTLAALLEELGHATSGIDGFEQLDLAPPDREQGGLHALVDDGGLLGHPEPERVLPEGEPVLQAAHHEPDVMDTGEHRERRLYQAFPARCKASRPLVPALEGQA